MKKFLIITFIFIQLIFIADVFSQDLKEGRGDPTLRRVGYHTGNKIGISFYNDGQISGFNLGVDIRGEWPLGSGYHYIGDLIPMIGAEFLNTNGDTIHSVAISRGPRKDQGDKKDPVTGQFRGFNPIPGYLNPAEQSVAMSHMPKTWPPEGWFDQPLWKDADGKTQWNGYFGRGIMNADQESYFKADDNADNTFNAYFKPDSTDLTRNGKAIIMAVRGFQWSSFLAQNCLFWLYDVKNDGTTIYRKTVFGTVVGTLAGGDGDSQDDLGFFNVQDAITYSYDSDGIGNKGQKVGWVGYAFLESPGNSFDGIDNDGDSQDPSSPYFLEKDFSAVTYNVGDTLVLINPTTYARSLYIVKNKIDTVYSLGVPFIINPGFTVFREGNIDRIENGIAIPSPTAYDGIDNDLDGLIDENESIHFKARQIVGLPGVKYINFKTGAGRSDLLIDEKRDNLATKQVLSWVKNPDGTVSQRLVWDADENGNWDPLFDDVGSDGVGPGDDGYLGPDPDGTEGNGRPDQGEPNFGKTDTEESDQIALTNFNFFNQTASPSMKNDEELWKRMFPGRFDVIPAQPQDGDFIYGSGYFPLTPKKIERFSIGIVFGVDYNDIFRNKKIVQQIYNAGYKFPQPPKKPKINITQEDGKVVIYWDGKPPENSKDLILKVKDFQGYKIYRATDPSFQDAREITNAFGVLQFDKPIAQFDLKDTISGFFYPSPQLLYQVGGTSFYLGDNTGIVNKWVDTTVMRGVTYYYAVCAYDRGDTKFDIFPTENSKFIFKTNTGQIITDDNTGYITPGMRPVGYTKASAIDFVKSQGFKGTGTIDVEIVDQSAIKNKFKYKVVFQDSAVQGYTKNWSLVDLQTPDTVLIPGVAGVKIVKPGETIDIPKGDTIIINGRKMVFDTTKYTAPYDTLVVRDTVFNGETPVVHGFRVQIFNDQRILRDTLNSKFVGINSTKPPIYTFNPFVWAQTGPGTAFNGIVMPYNYKIEFYNQNVETSVADTLFPNVPSNRIPPQSVNFKIKNLTTDKYIKFVYYKPPSTASTVHNIWFKEDINGVERRTWQLVFRYDTLNAPLETQGYLQIYTLKPFSKTDELTFTMEGAKINAENAKNSLDKIKVVPNPYVVTNDAEPKLSGNQTSGRGERKIRFTYVPPGSKIQIFTVRGELVKTLYQDNLFVGDVSWNLRTEENLDVAYGVYVYYIDIPNVGSKTGKFALIK